MLRLIELPTRRNQAQGRVRARAAFTTTELVEMMLIAAVEREHDMAEAYRWAVVERIVKEVKDNGVVQNR